MPSTPPRPPARPRRSLSAFLLAALLTAAAPAQVPIGMAVVGTSVGPATTGTSGLYLIPLTGGPVVPIPVTGLPPALQAPSGGSVAGVGTMDLRRTDGSLVVGAVTQGTLATPAPLDIYLLQLTGAAIAPAVVRITLGQVTAVSGAFVAAMPDGRVLVAASNGNVPLNNGPMAGSVFAIVDPSGPTITPLPLPNPPIAPAAGNLAGGLAVDPTGRYAYFALTLNIGSPGRVATLYRFELATGQTCVIASWTGQFTGGMHVDDDGAVRISASDGNSPANFVHTVRPAACGPAAVTSVPTAMPLGPIGAAGIALDRHNARFLLPSGAVPGYLGPQANTVSSVDPLTGVATVIASPPPGGWGTISRQSIVVGNAIDSYGPASPGLDHYWFENFPNAGGQPGQGNAGFALSLRSTAAQPVPSLLALSLGRGSLQMAGVEVLVDLGTVSASFLGSIFGPAAPHACPLPIPANPALNGLLVTAQSFHGESNGGLAASAGLAFRIQ